MAYKESLVEKILSGLADFIDLTNNSVSFKKYSRSQYDPRLHPFRNFVGYWYENKNEKEKAYKACFNLIRSGYIKRNVSQKTTGYILTPKGEEKILKTKLKKSKKKKLSDDRWLMVFFDIPEKERRKRENFRFTLRSLGFEQLQKSIWVTRFDLISEIKEIIRLQKLKKYAKQLLINEINE